MDHHYLEFFYNFISNGFNPPYIKPHVLNLYDAMSDALMEYGAKYQ
jgi:hypothetical protein